MGPAFQPQATVTGACHVLRPVLEPIGCCSCRPDVYFLSLPLSQPLSSVGTCRVMATAVAVCHGRFRTDPHTPGAPPRASCCLAGCLSPGLPRLALAVVPFSGLCGAPFKILPAPAGPQRSCSFRSCVWGALFVH